MKITIEVSSFDELRSVSDELTAGRNANTQIAAREIAPAKAEPKKAKPAEPTEESAAPVEEPTEESAAPVEEPAEPQNAEAKTADPTEVKLFLSNLLRTGHKDAVKKLLAKYEVKKLTELIDNKADQLDAFYEEAKEIK